MYDQYYKVIMSEKHAYYDPGIKEWVGDMPRCPDTYFKYLGTLVH